MKKKKQRARVTSNENRIKQAEARAHQAEARTQLAKTRTELAETRAEQAETRTEFAKTRTEHAEIRAEQAETRTEQVKTVLQNVMQNEGQLSSPIELLKNVSENVIGIGENLLEKNLLGKLTERQREILKLITKGQNTKQIAETLKLSPKTVEFHRLKLMKNLDVHDIPGLVCLAIRAGLSPLEK